MGTTSTQISLNLLKLRLNNSFSASMLPSEFCRIYLKLSPDDWGYRKRCISLIGSVTNVPLSTVEKWWDSEQKNLDLCPDYVSEILRREHQLRQIREALSF
jgi:hypothetical protein